MSWLTLGELIHTTLVFATAIIFASLGGVFQKNPV